MCGYPGPEGARGQVENGAYVARTAIKYAIRWEYSTKWVLKYLEYLSNSELKQDLSPQQQIMLEEAYRFYRSPEKVETLLACLSVPKIWDEVIAEAERGLPRHPEASHSHLRGYFPDIL
jgi:hypothetical protein